MLMGRQGKNVADVGYRAVFDLWPHPVHITYECTLLHVLVQFQKVSTLIKMIACSLRQE